MTLDDTSGFLTTFLELERARGNVTQLTQSQLLAGTKEYTKNLIILSKLTGESVDELDAQNKAMAADGVFQSQMTKMAVGDAELLQSSIAALPPGLKQLAKEVIGLGAPISDTSRELTAISDGRFNDAIQAFQRDLDPVAFSNAIKTISADVMKNAEAFGEAGLVTGMFSGALNDVVQSIGTAIDPTVIEDEFKAIGDNIKNLRNITSSFDRIASRLQIDRFELLAPILYDNSEAVVDFTSAFNEKIKDITEEGGALDQFKKSLLAFKDFIVTGKTPDNNDVPVPEIRDLLPEPGQSDYGEGGAQFGTAGFRDFGSGTPMMLHGSEMVLPERNVGELAEQLANAVSILPKTANAGNTTVGDTITNNNTSMDMSTLNANTTELIDLNKKVAQHLNTLVMIGSMTEKNTKDTKNNLANMGGSLV